MDFLEEFVEILNVHGSDSDQVREYQEKHPEFSKQFMRILHIKAMLTSGEIGLKSNDMELALLEIRNRRSKGYDL